MITQSIFDIVNGFLQLVFSVLPSLPDMPTVITDATDYFVNAVTSISGLFIWIYGQTLWTALIAVTLLLLNFEHAYKLTMWVVRKLPISSS